MDISRRYRKLASRAVATLAQDWGFWLLLTIVWLLYSFFEINRHRHLGTTGYDLGIFDQLIWHYAHFQGPSNSIRGLDNLLSDHFHPLLVVLAPLYWVWDDVRMLLLAQAALIASGAIALYFYAKGKLGQAAAVLVSLLYWTSWGIYGALGFDFHEVALAVPLLSLAAFSLLERRLRMFLVALGLLIFVKEDMPLVALAFGISWALRYRKWLIGLAIAGVTASYFLFVTRVLMPALSPWHIYSYWSYTQLGPSPVSAAINMVLHPLHAMSLFVDSPLKRTVLLATFLPFGFIAAFSPLALPMFVLLAERFFSANKSYLAYNYQYGLTLVPLLAFGLVYALSLLPRARGFSAPLIATLLSLSILLPVSLVPFTITDYFRSGPIVALTADQVAGLKAVRSIPSNASVAAQNNLIPQLSHRQNVYLLGEQYMDGPTAQYKRAAEQAQYIIYSDDPSSFMNPTLFPFDQKRWASYQSYIHKHYVLVHKYGSWLVWRWSS